MAAFLIVDEDRNFRDALAIGLRLDGHRALAVGDAEEARARLRDGGFDCCVVDAHLADADALFAHRERGVARISKESVASQAGSVRRATAGSRSPPAPAAPRGQR